MVDLRQGHQFHMTRTVSHCLFVSRHCNWTCISLTVEQSSPEYRQTNLMHTCSQHLHFVFRFMFTVCRRALNLFIHLLTHFPGHRHGRMLHFDYFHL